MSGPNHPRGTSNTNHRGSAASRRARKQWLLDTYGDGERCECAMCGVELTFETLTVDRWPTPGVLGGRYNRGNIRPACQRCQSISGNLLREALRAAGMTLVESEAAGA